MKGMRVEGFYYGTKVAGIVTESRYRNNTTILYVKLDTPIQSFIWRTIESCVLDISQVTRISG